MFFLVVVVEGGTHLKAKYVYYREYWEKGEQKVGKQNRELCCKGAAKAITAAVFDLWVLL